MPKFVHSDKDLFSMQYISSSDQEMYQTFLKHQSHLHADHLLFPELDSYDCLYCETPHFDTEAQETHESSMTGICDGKPSADLTTQDSCEKVKETELQIMQREGWSRFQVRRAII